VCFMHGFCGGLTWCAPPPSDDRMHTAGNSECDPGPTGSQGEQGSDGPRKDKGVHVDSPIKLTRQPRSFTTPLELRSLLGHPCVLGTRGLDPGGLYHRAAGSCARHSTVAAHLHRRLTVDALDAVAGSSPDFQRSLGLKFEIAELLAPSLHVPSSTDYLDEVAAKHQCIFEWLLYITNQLPLADVATWTPLTNTREVVYAIETVPQVSTLPPGVTALVASYVPVACKLHPFHFSRDVLLAPSQFCASD
jgi:hypothetical protein